MEGPLELHPEQLQVCVHQSLQQSVPVFKPGKQKHLVIPSPQAKCTVGSIETLCLHLISEPKKLCTLHVSFSQVTQNVSQVVIAVQKFDPSDAADD